MKETVALKQARFVFQFWAQKGCRDAEFYFRRQTWNAEDVYGAVWQDSAVAPPLLCDSLDLERGSSYAKCARRAKEIHLESKEETD